MQYLVQTSGEVITRHTEAYVIQAKSKEEAQESAKSRFMEEFCVADENIHSLPKKRTRKAVFAYVFLAISILLSYVNWTVGHDVVSIKPDYISCLYAVMFYASFIVRFKGVQKTVSSWIDIVFCFLIVLLLASFIQTILDTKTLNILWIKKIEINTKLMLPFALVVSWLGMKVVSVICYVLIGFISILNIHSLNDAIGSIFGPAYIICAFVGIALYLSVEPVLVEALPQLKRSIHSGLQYAHKDFIAAGNSAKTYKTTIQNSKIDRL